MSDELLDGRNRAPTYLHINQMTLNPRLVELVPVEILRRYHVLPLAENNGRITVAMADPSDELARSVIQSSLGSTTCLVKADPKLIDRLIDECCPDETAPGLRILTWFPDDPINPDLQSYMKAITGLLNGELIPFEVPKGDSDIQSAFIEQVSETHADLVCLHQPESGNINKQHLHTIVDDLVFRVPVSVMLLHLPRWPLKKVLLVIRNEDNDIPGIEWAVQLAARSNATVTILPLVPPLPLIYGEHMRSMHPIPALLNSQSVLGTRLREVSHQMDDHRIEGTIKLRQETSEWQIRLEVVEGDYDLVVIPSVPGSRIRRLVQGGLVSPLIKNPDRSMIIAKSIL
ncbi:MAG: hypothetical protein U9R58_02565 [Chloroflexota bacterium]|nr:hypothetical protein [Chloroflexota bacterium]